MPGMSKPAERRTGAESGLAPKCLPCTGGTHRACTGWALDEATDEVVDCGCVLHAVPDEE